MLERASEKPFEKFNEPGGYNNEGFSSFFILENCFNQIFADLRALCTYISP